MEISFHTKPFKSILLPWIAASFLGLVFMLFLHFSTYILFYSNKISLSEHFTGFWFSLYLYALIWPATIIHNYKAKILKVKHNGEVDPVFIKNYFIENRYRLIDEKPGFIRLEAQKWFDRLFKGSREVKIVYGDDEVSIELPAHKIYDVHHGFKFSGIFLRKA